MGCSICGRDIEARGWCTKHYRRWGRYGDPLHEARPRRSIEEIFATQMPGEPPLTTSLIEGCWDWTGCPQSQGYGYFTYVKKDGKKTQMLAHRAAHEIYIGEIPKGLFVLHSCDRPICCQPFHLRAGTNSNNMLDMWGRDRRDRNTAWGRHLR